MHVEKRKSGGRIKYYLAHSYREGLKVHKFRKYLGQDLPKEKLEERTKIAEKLIVEEIHKYNIISDPLHFELSAEEIEKIRALEKEIPLKIAHLSEQDWKTFSSIFTYNTNSIEGSKLNQQEVNELLEKDKWPDKSKEDIAEAYGVDEAIHLIRTTKEHISIPFIRQIHKTVFKNSKPFAGKLRSKGEEVVVMDSKGNVVHEGAPQSRINHLINELTRWYSKNRQKYPALVLAAVIHNQFENIHPFKDGNGRVGRILLNNILLKHGLPPVNINFKNRMEYYHSLQAYEFNKDLKPTIDLYLKEYNQLKKELGSYKGKRKARI
ncbi:MAG TPA: Fic family protein [Candidatus Nanoarchaeia archaeon]|nr:Fic family protein [Candidatus Nanoarchaeia archaeon]